MAFIIVELYDQKSLIFIYDLVTGKSLTKNLVIE